ncbi:phosphatidate cytidylyltransferase [Aquincola sp. MAHUQ-54]|uniref:Phosphatidate cytidylyltransferase n=1 Tax=Aquincola agrisoli TaxID=3119538 RepID=A0AAW9QIS0_9BURK
MLKQRVITAIVLLAVLLPAVFAPNPWPFALFTLVMVGAAGWEWGRLNASGAAGAVMLGLAVAVLCGVVLAMGWWLAFPGGAWWIAAALWIVGGALALRAGPAGWPRVPVVARWLLGLAMLCFAWLAMVQARSLGLNFLLSVFCLVWMADIAAYFGGRTFGRRKLAPTISPGKSWEGVWSGMAGVLVMALCWSLADTHWAVGSPSLYSLLPERLGWPGAVVALLVLAMMSVTGDLFESLVKRSAGAKDSSQLLPGHGGVLDRIDALLPVLPIAMAFASV